MTIAHRLALGFGLLVAMIVAVIAYHTSVVDELGTQRREMSIWALPASRAIVEMENSVSKQKLLVRKLFAFPEDPEHTADYAQKLDEVRRGFGSSLAKLERFNLPPVEAAARENIRAIWERNLEPAKALLTPSPTVSLDSKVGLAATTPALDQAVTAEDDSQPPTIDEREFAELGRLRELRKAVDALSQAAEAEDQQGLQRTEQASAQLERTNRVMLIAALASSLVVGVLTSRSIRRSLRRLTEATHAVAEGRFSYQLDASGDDELSRVASAFNTMTRRLEALDRMKKDFVARVSHDLRTPLVAMQETTDLLLTGLAGPLSEQQQRLVRLNRESGRRLASRIANLLALSRIEAGAFELDIRDHDLGELVRFVLREILVPARRRGLSLAVDLPTAPVRLRCDNERLTQVLENLLDNAIKYTPQGGQLEVRARAIDHSPSHGSRPWPAPGHIEISVANSGTGVSEADHVRVFESFYRAGAAPATRGTGLGLAICRDLVEAHNGLIWVDERPGGGARFRVALPWQPAPAREEKTISTATTTTTTSGRAAILEAATTLEGKP